MASPGFLFNSFGLVDIRYISDPRVSPGLFIFKSCELVHTIQICLYLNTPNHQHQAPDSQSLLPIFLIICYQESHHLTITLHARGLFICFQVLSV